MKITKLAKTPDKIAQVDWEERLQASDIEDLVEVFHTPLVGSYNWDYTEADNRIKRLYELGKKFNWNSMDDLDWSHNYPRDQYPTLADAPEANGMQEWPAYAALSEEKKLELAWHDYSWTLSQFLHGEQGALLVASQLVSCAPTYNAKLYAASQTFDEARHVETFNRYLQRKVGFTYPINKNLKFLIDKILSDERWDLKFIGMQIIIEGLALAAFNTLKIIGSDPLFRQLLHYVIRDEARHVTFGVNYLEDFVTTLSEKEREDRAQFAWEACVVMRDRILATDVYSRFVDDSEEGIRKALVSTSTNAQFRSLLFTRVMPNLARVGLLTDAVRPKYEELGLLEYEQAPGDWEIDWAHMEKPYESMDEITAEAEAGAAELFGTAGN